MNDADKREFLDALTMVGEIYDQSAQQVRKKSPIYWEALRHRTIGEVKTALNDHVRDPDRGRFFPKPADIEAQMQSVELWPDAEEAWAMCPKDEYTSAAITEEAAQALGVAQDLINDGDMIAARMAFKSAYNRLVDEARREGKKPHWFVTLGHDKDGRYAAEVKAVEMQNKLLPSDQQRALPKPPVEEGMTVDQLLLSAPEGTVSEEGKKQLDKLHEMLGNKAKKEKVA